jgi:hypothetical protein
MASGHTFSSAAKGVETDLNRPAFLSNNACMMHPAMRHLSRHYQHTAR